MRKAIPLLACLLTLIGGCQQQETVAEAQQSSENPGRFAANSEAPEKVDPYATFKDLGESAANSHAIILMYHDIVEERGPDAERYDITVEQFRKDLEFIQEEGGVFVSLEDVYLNLTEGRALPHRAVCLTFDDNYQRVADLAVPILKEFDAPWTMFVHTDFVGNTSQGRPKMSWETLKGLMETSKLTVGGHTASHPDDITTLENDKQESELTKPFAAIEENLKLKPVFMAWANGKYGELTKYYAQNAGYRMALTMESGLTGQSPGILEVCRYPWQKLRMAWDEREQWLKTHPIWSRAEFALKDAPLEKLTAKYRSADFVAIKGGIPSTILDDGRTQVGDLIKEYGAEAGINGGFFVMAAVASSDNRMIGPCITSNRPEFLPSSEVPFPHKLKDRPLVLWNKEKVVIKPYDPFLDADDPEKIQEFLPSATDVFLAGCWLVCDGIPLSKEQVLLHGPSDAGDWRRRACIGWTKDGEVICIASLDSVSAEWLAQGAAELGCHYAVMLDSGFSTSLVLGPEVLATGHSNKDHASRPVPHAILLNAKNLHSGSPNADSQTAESKP